MSPSVRFLCPSAPFAGGVRAIYRHVDHLNAAGFNAAVVHQDIGFRPHWFDSETTPVLYPPLDIRASDILVFSEIEGPSISAAAPRVAKVILNQNPYYTFRGYPQDLSNVWPPYTHPEVLASITVSRDAQEYIQHCFPAARIFRVRYGIRPQLFNSHSPKRRQVAFMPRKHPEDVQQLLSILKLRGALAGYSIIPIHNRHETEAAAILRESAVFLSFGYPEGFGLPPAEAMACGCVTIGYHGMGGREYFTPEHGFPIAVGDIVGFARTAERILRELAGNIHAYDQLTDRAARFIASEYSPDLERDDVLRVWREILSLAASV